MDLSVRSTSGQAGGVTLLEVIVVVAIVAALLVVAQPSYHIIELQRGLTAAVNEYAQAIQRAQLLSQSVRGDSAWGVIISSTSTTLFKGATYAGRDSTYDEVYSFTTPVTLGGTTEIDFTKWIGTTTPATTTIAANGLGTSTVTIDAKGIVSY